VPCFVLAVAVVVEETATVVLAVMVAVEKVATRRLKTLLVEQRTQVAVLVV
jgi:hypothetical protein